VTFEITTCRDLDEFTQAFLAIGQYFGAEPNEERMERFTKNLPLERMHAARANGHIVGGAGAFPFTMTVPGGQMPCAGVTVVGVYPTHRRKGALRAMMKTQLDDVRERGEPIAALWSSEERIYTRFGYGLASLQGEINVARDRSAYAVALEPKGQARIVDFDEAKSVFPPVYEQWAREVPGAYLRTDAWWEYRILGDPPEWRQGGPKRFVVLERNGDAVAYAIYRHEPKWEEGVSQSVLRVGEAIAIDPEAMAEIWRYLLDVDWTDRVQSWLVPIDHPLLLLLAEPRRLKFRVGDGLWVRLVDVGAALSGRSYAADGEVVFEVADEFMPDNAGRWKLVDGNATRTDDDADIQLDVRDLGSVFLGGFTFAELQRGLRIRELRKDAIERADAMFRTDRAPWCPEIF
jgi:predicted acetyltransferase